MYVGSTIELTWPNTRFYVFKGISIPNIKLGIIIKVTDLDALRLMN